MNEYLDYRPIKQTQEGIQMCELWQEPKDLEEIHNILAIFSYLECPRTIP